MSSSGQQGGDSTNAVDDTSTGGAAKKSSSSTGTSTASTANVVFPVGRAGKRELGRALRGAASNPQKTIETFQQNNSLHSMLAKAFGTQPRHEIQTRSKRKTTTIESLDSDSVMEFLSHLGVSQYAVHKRISDTLLKKLEDEIKRTGTSNDIQPLLDLLQNSWAYAVALPELRPIIWAVLRQLGEQTPQDVLLELARRADDKTDADKDKQPQTAAVVLKHAEIFRPLPVLLKKLVWESDWYNRIPSTVDLSPTQYLQQARGTLWYQTIAPTLQAYCQNATLVQAANRMLGVGPRERKVVTTHRRALTAAASAVSASTTAAGTTATGAASGTAASLLRGAAGAGAASHNNPAPSTRTAATTTDPPSGKAIAQLRVYLSDSASASTGPSSSSSSSSTYRPKLLYALLSILIAQHGAVLTGGASTAGSKDSSSQQYHGYLGGATYLHCTLVADLLLSAGGPLPKAYQHVISLARLLDECVNEGTVSDKQLVKIQAVLGLVFGPPDTGSEGDKAAAKNGSAVKKAPEKAGADKAVALGKSSSKKSSASSHSYTPISSAVKRQLNRILTSSMEAMKLADPQSLFLNDVTDEIAPGYSKIIKRPMCISQMEKKVHKNAYEKLDEFVSDVKLMFQNCVEYNKGPAGQWFRGEAQRQKKFFRDEILPQARKLYQSEIVNRKTPLPLNEEEDKKAAAQDRKRKAEALGATLAAGGATTAAPRTSAVHPLPAMTKKPKKDKETEYLPSMPALALMLLADPFVVRIILARVLRELRASVVGGNSVPAASAAIPSLLQLLHMAHWSSQICAIRGKRYFVPSAGVQPQSQDASQAGSDPTTLVPYATLRQDTPLVLRLLLEAELDKRMVVGADLYDASQSSMTTSVLPSPINVEQWGGSASVGRENTKERTYYMQVAISLLQVALVHVCQPDAPNDTSLAVTFPKFALALEQMTAPAALMGDAVFFKCLIFALLRHKQRLKPAARDAIVHSWMGWLRVGSPQSSSNSSSGSSSSSKKKKKRGCMTMAVHEYIIMLLNEWSSIGNLLLPRDTLLQFAADIVQTANETELSDERKFAHLWNLSSSFQEDKDEDGNSVEEPPPLVAEFRAVYKQYQRLLKNLPAVNATQWKEQVGIGQQQPEAATKEATTKETEIAASLPLSPSLKHNAAEQGPAATATATATNNEGDAGGDSPVDMATD